MAVVTFAGEMRSHKAGDGSGERPVDPAGREPASDPEIKELEKALELLAKVQNEGADPVVEERSELTSPFQK